MKTWILPLVALLGLCTAPAWAEDYAEPDGSPTGLCEKPVSVTPPATLDGLALEIAELYSRGLLYWCEDVPEAGLESEALEPLTPCCNCTLTCGKTDPWSDYNPLNKNLKGTLKIKFGAGFGLPEFNCTCYCAPFCSYCNDTSGNLIAAYWVTTTSKRIGCVTYKYKITYKCNATHRYCPTFVTTNRGESVTVNKYKCCNGCLCPVLNKTWNELSCNYNGSGNIMSGGKLYYNANPYWGGSCFFAQVKVNR
jgi:hypothetical protein